MGNSKREGSSSSATERSCDGRSTTAAQVGQRRKCQCWGETSLLWHSWPKTVNRETSGGTSVPLPTAVNTVTTRLDSFQLCPGEAQTLRRRYPFISVDKYYLTLITKLR